MTDNPISVDPKRGLFRHSLFSFAAVLGVTLLLASSFFAAYASHARAASSSLVTLPDSVTKWVSHGHITGRHPAATSMTIGLLLQTSHQDQQRVLMAALYKSGSPSYHKWLNTGEFDARFAPSASSITAAKNFLTQAGLHLVPNSPSQMLLLASGTSSQIEAAFHTQINTYRMPDGTQHFANSTALQIPSSLSGVVAGVTGLHDFKYQTSHAQPDQKPNLSPPYGAGPYGRGLTPSQIAGIYNTTPVYKSLKDKGQGKTLGLFELSGYTRSDIGVYEKTFKLPKVPFIDRPVLGGPIAVNGSVDYGADEVELDIDLQIATAPGVKRILVYNGPNTELGVIGEYLQIAKDNQADSISSSWGECEYFTDTTIRTGELQAFTQMALQGQSIFASAGDNGAYDCGPSSSSGLTGNDALQVDDPASNPFVTGVGGTSFRKQNGGPVNFDPGKNPNPTYPGTSAEDVWNRGCTPTSCLGAGGGGVSRVWASSDYVSANGQPLPGVIEPGYSQTGAYCGQTPPNLCRQVPDVSIDGDPGTGYAIYCSNTGSDCLNPAYSANGWIRFGGTSCGAPIWAGITALYDSYHKGRIGLFNYYVYRFDSKSGYQNQLHDITIGDNGYYPAGTAYDMSTGVGTPNVYKLIKP